MGIVETLVHGWDIAKATGQQPDMDPELSEFALAVARQMPQEQVRQPGIYGPEAPCAGDAPVHECLAAYLGRPVSSG